MPWNSWVQISSFCASSVSILSRQRSEVCDAGAEEVTPMNRTNLRCDHSTIRPMWIPCAILKMFQRLRHTSKPVSTLLIDEFRSCDQVSRSSEGRDGSCATWNTNLWSHVCCDLCFWKTYIERDCSLFPWQPMRWVFERQLIGTTDLRSCNFMENVFRHHCSLGDLYTAINEPGIFGTKYKGR
jgi:hypothetical protein